MSAPKRVVEVFINSYRDRIIDQNNSASREFKVLLNDVAKNSLRLLKDETKATIKLFSLSIPNTLYNFGEQESRLLFEDVSGLFYTFQIDIERVYATPTELITELNAKALAVSGLDVSFNYNDTTKKIGVMNTSATVPYRLVSSFRYFYSETVVGPQDINDRLGFTADYTNTWIGPGNSLTANDPIKMVRSNNWYLALLEQSSAGFRQSIIPSIERPYRIIGSVPASNFGVLSNQTYVSSFGYDINIGISGLSELNFSVLDDAFRPVNLGANFPITLSVQIEFY